MTTTTQTPVTIANHHEAEPGLANAEHIYSVTIFANELSRDGVSVDIDGMDFSNYRKNPVVLFAHDYSGRTESSGLPIGRTISLGRTQDGRIRADFEFLSGDPFADRVRNAWNRGFLRGASIGWRAIEARPSQRGRGLRVVKSELIEWSIVAVPADPDALRGAYTRIMKALINDASETDIPSPLRAETTMQTLPHGEDRGEDGAPSPGGEGWGEGENPSLLTPLHSLLRQEGWDESLPRTRSGGENPASIHPEPVEEGPQIDLTETRTLLKALTRAVRPDSADPEFCRDPPA